MEEVYKPIGLNFRETLTQYAAQQKYVSLQYLSDIREYYSTKAILKEIYSRDNAEYLQLSTGEEIRLDRIARVEGQPAPGFEDYFTCEC